MNGSPSGAAGASGASDAFADETAVHADGEGRWSTRLHAAWHIGDTANGGYALTPVLRALGEIAGHPDPLSVTTHFLRPATGDLDGVVTAEQIRVGRTTGVVRGALEQEDRQRLHVTAVFGAPVDEADDGNDDGDRGDRGDHDGDGDDDDGDRGDRGDRGDHDGDAAPLAFAPSAPGSDELPSPEACVDRRELAQGVELPILSRVDVRIHPDHAVAGGSGRAVIAGWIRLADGTAPSVLALPLFADAFPPSLYPLLGEVGWVPTIELTVHVRHRPAPGWVRARFECDDLHGGRMIESGTLWDSSGRVVARSRQLGLHLPR